MDHKAIYKFCKDLGCCDGCCLRYIGLKNPNVYEDIKKSVKRYADKSETTDTTIQPETATSSNISNMDSTNDSAKLTSTDISNTTESPPENGTHTEKDPTQNGSEPETNGNESPKWKRRKMDVCVCCLGILQEVTWKETFGVVKEALDKKGYECDSFACALSAPIATMLREKAIALRLGDAFPEYDAKTLTALKEAWKWSFGVKLASHISKTLDSGAVSPVLVTISYDYADDTQELEILKSVAPELFEERSKQKRRFATEFTRRSVEQALERATMSNLCETGDGDRVGGLATVSSPAHCVSVFSQHAPMYLAGRYIKLSRNLPQSPWILSGKRVLPSSVQEIIFAPLAKLYKLEEAEAEQKLKFVAAGREDVDVRCLGDGRPFAIEITDPRRQLSGEELRQACDHITDCGLVIVRNLLPITKEDLVQLKKGEETKCKTYEALCIKLGHSKHDNLPPEAPITVTSSDIDRMNSYRNTPEGAPERISIAQKTPIRVLHRRPLLTRTRAILEVDAKAVSGHPSLFTLRLRTSAGTYVKEWVHGELRRTGPALPTVLAAPTDLIALDVTAVHLEWPPT